MLRQLASPKLLCRQHCHSSKHTGRLCSRRAYGSTGPNEQKTGAGSRVDRLFARFPRFLHRYVDPLRSAPVSHVSAFLLLHELTAIVPLFGLAATFHYAQWLPPYISEGKWVNDGIEKFGRWFRRRGWLGAEGRRRDKWWTRGEGGVKIVVELATAYAITKALLPLRLILSVWATPWFAQAFVLPGMSMFRRAFARAGKRSPQTLQVKGSGTGSTQRKPIQVSSSKKSVTDKKFLP